MEGPDRERRPDARARTSEGPARRALPVGTLAIGDLHVDVEHAASVAAFTAFCARQHARPCLVILGDLFEYWIGKGQARSAGGRRCLGALRELAESGTQVLVVPGNRDFLLAERDAREGGFAIEPDGFVGETPDGGATLLVHGDELCTRDVSYQRLRRVVRSRPVRLLARALPTRASEAIAKRLRRASTLAVAAKPDASKRPQWDEAERRTAAAGARTLLTGHVHAFRDETREGLRWLCVDAFGDGSDAFLLATDGWRATRSDAVGRRAGATAMLASDSDRGPGTGQNDQTMPTIAIDGPSGVGKSTAARLLAQRLGLFFLDTGAMYRAVTRAVLERGVDPHDADACLEVARGLDLHFRADGALLVDGEEAGPNIRTERVTKYVSPVSAHGAVRDVVVARQREIVREMGGAVAEGRDTTTVVFPAADLKIFLTASALERARRRANELGVPDEVGRILDDICRRDEYDSTREHSPLRQADDAIRVETDGLGVEQVVERLAFLFEEFVGAARTRDARS